LILRASRNSLSEISNSRQTVAAEAWQGLAILDQEGPDPAQLRTALASISNDGRRTVEIVARIRALAKNSAPQKVALDLRELVSEVFSLVESEAARKHIVLQTEVAGELPSVTGERVQLQQVLLNLCINGIEAMNGITQRSLELAIKIDRGDHGEVVVAVSDRGTGIKPQELDRVFKAFHTTKNASLGMGLAICRSIIEAHGGRLWAEPNIGPGTTFKFSLPAKSPGPADG